MGRLLLALFVCLAAPARAQLDCQCEQSKPEMWQSRQCSLCREAELQPKNVKYFFLKDINPTKPNRLLILPRMHSPNLHPLESLPQDLRTELFQAAIDKGQELWGDQWGLAYNGGQVRTQCHTHIHIGKLLEGQENEDFVLVDGAKDIPVKAGEGLWIHPVGKKLHVHLGGQRVEPVLMR